MNSALVILSAVLVLLCPMALAEIRAQDYNPYHYTEVSCTLGANEADLYINPRPVYACDGMVIPQCGRGMNGSMSAVLFCPNDGQLYQSNSEGWTIPCDGNMVYCGITDSWYLVTYKFLAHQMWLLNFSQPGGFFYYYLCWHYLAVPSGRWKRTLSFHLIFKNIFFPLGF